MAHVFWYKLRKAGTFDRDEVQGWETTHNAEYVLDQLKKIHGKQLAYVYYVTKDDRKVTLYRDVEESGRPRWPVTPEIAGSNPVVPANNKSA